MKATLILLPSSYGCRTPARTPEPKNTTTDGIPGLRAASCTLTRWHVHPFVQGGAVVGGVTVWTEPHQKSYVAAKQSSRKTVYARTTENKHVPFAHPITTPDMNIDPSPALRQGTAAPAPPPPFPRTPRRRNPANRTQKSTKYPSCRMAQGNTKLLPGEGVAGKMLTK